MNKTYYVCKYTPVELLSALGADCALLNEMPEGFERAEQVINPNVCGFGKSVLEAVMSGRVRELVLVNCCDTIRSVCDVLDASGAPDFLFMMDIGHEGNGCSRERLAGQLKALAAAYGRYRRSRFDPIRFRESFRQRRPEPGPYIGVLGARMGDELFDMVKGAMPMRVGNLSCVNNRTAGNTPPPEIDDFDGLIDWYAGVLLGQLPCMRMTDTGGRRQLYEDPDLAGIIYHTVKFCDFYSFEYSEIKNLKDIPLLKIESDYTLQSRGQLATRLEAFAETLGSAAAAPKAGKEHMGKGYFAGIDSGSASTDVVILDKNKKIVAGVIMPTGAGAAGSAGRALEKALKQAGLSREDLDSAVTTGYGRRAVTAGDRSITEITCHARGAHFLDPAVRTVIDIGGQDSKIIRLDEDGRVINFVMNDKCAAGTGRFLEAMARAMEMSLDEFSQRGISFREDITISSMCTVFAESEVVSLVAGSKSVDDIVHGLHKSVAAKTLSLIRRVGGAEKYMMTGGVSLNTGLVRVLSEKLGTELIIRPEAQLCGALGAALFAADTADMT